MENRRGKGRMQFLRRVMQPDSVMLNRIVEGMDVRHTWIKWNRS